MAPPLNLALLLPVLSRLLPTSPLPRATQGQPTCFQDSPPAPTSIHRPCVPPLSPSLFHRVHLAMACRVLCAGTSLPCPPFPSHMDTFVFHKQGDWLRPPYLLQLPPKPSPRLSPRLHLSDRPLLAVTHPASPASTRHPHTVPHFTASNDQCRNELTPLFTHFLSVSLHSNAVKARTTFFACSDPTPRSTPGPWQQ